jgi:hypothetical protein
MIKFHFVNGTVIDDNTTFQKAVITLQRRGMRFYQTSERTLVPVNSNTIMFVENVPEEDEYEARGPQDISAKTEGDNEGDSGRDSEKDERSEKVDTEEAETKELTEQEKKDAILAHMKEMSECKHEDHDIYFQETSVGAGKKAAKRYFPVCAKCGVRERYVKASDLSDDQKENAKIWDK